MIEGAAMMGKLENQQDKLFYNFNLEELVPKNHLLRHINAVLDLKGLRDHLEPYYSSIGRPSIDPELMIRILLVGYCFGIRSERRLCEEISLNLAYRWFCKLDIEDSIPNHSTFSKARHGRFRQSDALRYVFEQILEVCIQEGLVGGEGFAVDASIVRADASKQNIQDRDTDNDWPTPRHSTRPVREYLEGLSEQDKPAKRLSLSDPAARWTAAMGGPAFFAYSTNYLIDTDFGIILDVEATPAHRTAEVDSTRTMIDRVESKNGIKPHRLIGDTAYGNAELLGWMVEDKHIDPHVPVWDKTARDDGTFSSVEFTFDLQDNCYICPAGKTLRHGLRSFKKKRTGITKANTKIYRASAKDCADCTFKELCCPNTPSRKIARSIHEEAREIAREINGTDEYKQSRKDRKKVEILFAHMKRILKVDRLRLRGPNGANDEFVLTAAAQNLRRLAKHIGTNPPGETVISTRCIN
jgi:transposase